MKKITSEEFKAEIKIDPAWASKLTEPREITDYCDMRTSRIAHLSPLLYFTGKDETGNSATFFCCDSLILAEGNFSGSVSFSYSNIRKIGKLKCGRTRVGNSAFFTGCESLKIAEGNFPGFVSFANTSIEEVRDLTCEPNDDGIRLNVSDCKNLEEIPTRFNPKEVRADPELLKKLKTARLKKAAIKHLEPGVLEI